MEDSLDLLDHNTHQRFQLLLLHAIHFPGGTLAERISAGRAMHPTVRPPGPFLQSWMERPGVLA